jgi:hypothetical protein
MVDRSGRTTRQHTKITAGACICALWLALLVGNAEARDQTRLLLAFALACFTTAAVLGLCHAKLGLGPSGKGRSGIVVAVIAVTLLGTAPFAFSMSGFALFQLVAAIGFGAITGSLTRAV